MLDLDDFYHIPALEPALAAITPAQHGLIVVAGLDPRDAAAGGAVDPPSGRATFFRILQRSMLQAQKTGQIAVVASQAEAQRFGERRRRGIRVFPAGASHSYAEAIAAAVAGRPDLLIVDRITPESAGPVLAAAVGLSVLAQWDTLLHGAEVARSLAHFTAANQGPLRWVVSTQGIDALCPDCRTELASDHPDAVAFRRSAHGAGALPLFDATGCVHCGGSGRQGHVTAFDIYRGGDSDSLFPIATYVQELVSAGRLAPADALGLESERVCRAQRLLQASEERAEQARSALSQRLAELESAQRVLHKRTEAVISLQQIAKALLAPADLSALGEIVCREVQELCGAARVIIYRRTDPDGVRVLAAAGWAADRLPGTLPLAVVLDEASDTSTDPAPFDGWPPGIARRAMDVEGVALRAGLRVPLVTQERLEGVMFVHTEARAGFLPAQHALLAAFAGAAAVALQRAALVTDLRLKIAELEAAQEGLRTKERLERELELARQVQLSLLPRTFPQTSGFEFAARCVPARRVGGDFYDVFEPAPGRIGLVIGDVSDKGMPAALYMALARSLLLAEARREQSPRAALESVNRLLRELGDPEMFVSLFYGVIETASGELRWARAGHDLPLLVREGEIRELGGEGTILGPFEALGLSEESIRLLPGDRVVLYTDGLPDTGSVTGEMFGMPALSEICGSIAGVGAEDGCEAVLQHIDRFRGAAEQGDDMTLVVCAVR